jgi:hypothetical protein
LCGQRQSIMLEKFVQELDSVPSAVRNSFKKSSVMSVVRGSLKTTVYRGRAGAGRRSTVTERLSGFTLQHTIIGQRCSPRPCTVPYGISNVDNKETLFTCKNACSSGAYVPSICSNGTHPTHDEDTTSSCVSSQHADMGSCSHLFSSTGFASHA